MADLESGKFTVGIPYFFYDFIGRILPGAFLCLGTILTWYGTRCLYDLKDDIQRLPKVETGAAAFVLALGLLIFINVAALLGSMLASLAHHLVGKRKFWQHLTLVGLWTWLGVPHGASKCLQDKFRIQFGFELTESTFKSASNLCAYHLIGISPTLGTMSARHDAELLGAQSMVLAIAWMELLHMARWICCWRELKPHWLHGLIWFLILSVSLVGFAWTFEHHREKKLYGRFALYLAGETASLSEPSSKAN